jgi:preprotein translocase subunit SecG
MKVRMSVLLWLILIVVVVAVIVVAMYWVRKSRRAGSVLAARVSDRGNQ